MKDKNSMFYWYPIIKEINIPQPYTEMYKFTEKEFEKIQQEKFPKTLFKNCLPIADRIGYPLFMRTDQSSFKHFWKKTCFVKSNITLEDNIMELLVNSIMQGCMSYLDHGLVFREYIPMETKFTAFFGDFPVNKERRYFIKNGKVQCHHPYWYPNAIRDPSIQDWKPILDRLNFEMDDEIELLTRYAENVGVFIDGYWSIDFSKGKDGNWYLIDMAEGNQSFHWLECEYCPEEQVRQYSKRKNK